MHNMKFTILTLLNVQCIGINNIHTGAQPSPPPFFRALSSFFFL